MTQQQGKPADAITRSAWAIAQMSEEDGVSWRFSLVWQLACRFESERDLRDLHAALAEFRKLPTGVAGRAKLAAILMTEMVRTGQLKDLTRLAEAVELAALVRADPAPLPWSREACAVVRAMDLQVAGMNGRAGFNPLAALAEVDELSSIVGTAEPYAGIVDMARLTLKHLVATAHVDISSSAGISAGIDAVRHRLPDTPDVDSRLDILRLVMEAHTLAMRGDVDGAQKAFARLTAWLDRLPPDDPRVPQLAKLRTTLEPMFKLAQPGGIADPLLNGQGHTALDADMREQLIQMRRLADLPGLEPTERAVRLSSIGAVLMGIGADHPEMLDASIADLAQSVAYSPQVDPRRPFYQLQLGTAHMLRYEQKRRITDLNEGIRQLEAARAALGTSAHAFWTMTTMPLAQAYRLSNRRRLSLDTALAGLRGHAWSVLLQSDTPAAAAAARHASSDAIDVARWCIMDGQPELAARALDMGRGLLLHATTQRHGIADRLIELGEPNLAEQWRAAVARAGAGEAPTQLRHRVMSALAGIPADGDGVALDSPAAASARLLDSPDLNEVRAALGRIGADVLVYLVPGDDKSGAAVIVPAGGPVRALLLPDLNKVPVGFGSGATRELVEAMEPGREMSVRGRVGLADICDWAWRVAIGPLFDRALTMPAGRPLRLVLIPMRELTAVPWHAARRPMPGAPGRHRYAVEQAVFSYAPSARLLCDSAGATEVTLDDTALVLGDPDTGGAAAALPAARAEAIAVYEEFYRRGVYLGRRADGAVASAGAGDRRGVLDRLLDGAAGTVLHLACHGMTRAGGQEHVGAEGESSYLALAGGDRLSAEELIAALTERANQPVGLAVLAACNSGVPARGHDEAFSVATALLAGGVRAVVSTLWSVPDAPTSVLMFMFHRYLRREGLRPVDALHRAQLWMLSPDREIPSDMPEALRRFGSGPSVGIDSWAGFVHSGR